MLQDCRVINLLCRNLVKNAPEVYRSPHVQRAIAAWQAYTSGNYGEYVGGTAGAVEGAMVGRAVVVARDMAPRRPGPREP